MVATDASKANDQIAASHQELRALAAQLQKFLNLQNLPDWAPESIANTRAAESEASLRRIDSLLSRKFGVVGLEGVGKSTLINAIFGQPVVPTDSDQPGTATPIFVHASSNNSTAYAIETEEGAIRPCEDYEELTSYVLQRHNPNNHKQARHASISQPAPHLPPGLCLVDLPGSAGMASSFRESAISTLEYVDRVILVVQDRNAGPALELAHDVITRGIEICAVAANLQMSKLVDPGNLQPLPDHEVRDHIAATRDYIERNFLDELPQLEEKCEFFAFHFPSMQSLSIAPDANHWIPAHVEEIYRFSDWFTGSIGNATTTARLQKATKDLADKLAQSKNQTLIAREQIDGLLSSDPTTQEQVCQKFAQHETEIQKRWTRSVTNGRIKEAKRKAWDDFAPAAMQLKADLRHLQQTTRRELPDNWWAQNWQLKSEISENINRNLSSASDRMNTDAVEVLQEFSDVARQLAHETAVTAISILPIDLGPLPMTSPASFSIWVAPLIDPERQSFAEYDSAKVIERYLSELTVAEMSITLVEGDQIYERFHAALSGVVSDNEKVLKQRLDALVRILRGGSSPALKQARQDLSNQVVELEEIASKTNSLRDRIASIELVEEEHLDYIRAGRKQAQDRFKGKLRHIPRSPM